jgi:hypothetical protein
MRTEVKARKTDQDRNWQASQPDSSPGQQQHSKESNRRIDVPRREGMIFRIGKVRAVPHVLCFHRRARATSRNFDRAADEAGDRQRDQHRQQDPRPVLVSAPKCKGEEREANEKMFWPIAEPADVAHEIPHPRRLMIRHERGNCVIEIKRRRDRHDHDDDPERPIDSGALLHK